MALNKSRKTSASDLRSQRRRKKIRSKVSGTAERPRLSVFKSNSGLYTQLIDDVQGKTLVALSTKAKEYKGKFKNNVEGAKELGAELAKKAVAASIEKVVFDRGGSPYHGRVKALAEGARDGGLKF